MSTKTTSIVALSEMTHGQEADVFALLTTKEELKTRDGKPYFKVTFRDQRREVCFPIWHDSAWSVDCRDGWQPGGFFKLRAIYRDTNFGPQLDIRKIRPIVEADADDGFDPLMCLPRSRFDAEQMFGELLEIVDREITDRALQSLVRDILLENRATLLRLPAATRNHHAYVAGFLEHVLSMTRTCVQLGAKYDEYYPDMKPRLNRSVLAAGAILHDIGKLREIEQDLHSAAYTPSGCLIGHLVQGRDIVREAAVGRQIDPDVLLRLEHIILSHQRLPEWGSPKPPMTPEALIVHYADDLDAKYHMMYTILRDDGTPGEMTSKKNTLYQQVYRGPPS